MKIIGLVPCLMRDNNRDTNNACLDKAFKVYTLDDIIIYDQCYKETDYDTRFKYIGHSDKPAGFVEPRNKLLEYFYNSDADYAMFFDANECCSSTCYNELINIFKHIREKGLNVDCICATMGLQISGDRMEAKKRADYKEKFILTPLKFKRGTTAGYYTMHGMIIKNFKKYYGITPYIDKRCDPKVGTSEDTYFAMLLRNSFTCFLAPTIVFSKIGGAKTSTWAEHPTNYIYPKVETDLVIQYVQEANLPDFRKPDAFVEKILDRIDKRYVENLKEYKPKPKRVKEVVDNKVKLF